MNWCSSLGESLVLLFLFLSDMLVSFPVVCFLASSSARAIRKHAPSLFLFLRCVFPPDMLLGVFLRVVLFFLFVRCFLRAAFKETHEKEEIPRPQRNQ